VYSSSERDVQNLARVVYGESRGESSTGQSAVAHSAINRVKHGGYPNTLDDVINQKYGGNRHQYETLDLSSHDNSWESAKRERNSEYTNAYKASSDALSGRSRDPTGGATSFAADNPNPATSSNQWYRTEKTKIGNHYFARQIPH